MAYLAELLLLVQFQRTIASNLESYKSLVHIPKTQSIVDGLKKDRWSAYYDRDHHAIYILDDRNIFSLNGIAFNDDNITRLHLDGKSGMKLESLHGIKRWPKELSEIWLTNMQNFRVSSLNQIPDSVKSITLMNVIFDSSLNCSIKLSTNLSSLSITHCSLTHEAMHAFNIGTLEYLVDIDLAYLDHTEIMEYSSRYPIYFPSATLKHLCIDYKLMEHIITHQTPQRMHKLEYILVKTNNAGQVDKTQMTQMIRVYFDCPDVDINI